MREQVAALQVGTLVVTEYALGIIPAGTAGIVTQVFSTAPGFYDVELRTGGNSIRRVLHAMDLCPQLEEREIGR